jgi:hypothetical protein
MTLPENYQVLGGAVVALGDRLPLSILLTGALPDKLPGRLQHRGQLVIRYATAFLYEPDTFYIQRIVDDFGRDFRGQDAIDFAYQKGDAYPRATVLGVRASSGADEQIFLKQLDLARPMLPVIYSTADASIPVAQINAAVWVDDAVSAWHRAGDDDPHFSADLIRAVPGYALPLTDLPLLPERLPSVSL